MSRKLLDKVFEKSCDILVIFVNYFLIFRVRMELKLQAV